MPQGSVLGPQLFILYVNDICNVSNILDLIMFADDTNLFGTGDNIECLSKIVSSELSKINRWFAVNRLSLNVSKTNYMVFSSKFIAAQDIFVHIDNKKIERVHKTKFLGVIVDEKLNWKEQIAVVKSKLCRTIGIIKKIQFKLEERSLLQLYYALFYPYLNYCLEIWGNACKSHVKCLYILQKKIIRIIGKKNHLEQTNGLFHKFKIIKFFDLVELKTCVIMYKASKNMLPKNLLVLFDLKKNIYYNTRNKNNFLQKDCRTNLKSRCISVIGIKSYNSLNDEIKTCNTIKNFINKFKISKVLSYCS